MTERRKNVLVLSAGRRVELMNAFMQERSRLVPQTKVFAMDIQPHLSAACQVADQAIAGPRATAPDYPAFIERISEEFDIGLIVPTIDTELLPLALLREKLQQKGTWISVPGAEFVRKCRDKRLTGELFDAIDCRYPKLMGWDTATFPAFAKPASGSSSKGALLLTDDARLSELRVSKDDYMLMEFIGPPFVEYTVDAYFDCNSRLRCLVPRQRLEVRAGEVSKGLTRRHALYDRLISNVGRWDDLYGCVTIQVFYDSTSREVVGLEVNPRFGGGYPLTHAAGGNYVGWLLAEVFKGSEIAFCDNWESNLLMLRYDAAVMVHNVQL